MKKKLPAFFLLMIATSLLPILSLAQSLQWAKQLGGVSTNCWGMSVATDGVGNVYTAGVFLETIDFDPGSGTFNLTSAGGQDVFISKLDASGNFIWAKQLGGTSNDSYCTIIIDGSGNIYTTGWFWGTADFDPGPGTYNLTSVGGYGVFVSKLDASGNFIWAKQWGGTSADISTDIATDAAGNVYTSGFFNGTVDFDPGVGTFNLTAALSTLGAFISKLDASGNFVWAKKWGGTSAESSSGYSIAVDASGNIYTCGNFVGTVDFDPGVGTFNLTAIAVGGYHGFISKLDASGNFVWAKAMDGTSITGRNQSITTDAAGNVYTTGWFDGTVDFDLGAGTFNLTAAGKDIFISKLDASGNFIYAKQLGGISEDEGWSIVTDACGNVYTTGYFYGTVDFDPGLGIFNLTAPAGVVEAFISKLDPSGNFILAKQFGGTSLGMEITTDAAENVYTTGWFSGTGDFDPDSGIFNLTAAGSLDAFISKYNLTLTPPDTIIGNTTICSASSNTYSITAVSGATSYTWVLPSGWTGSSTTTSITTTASSTGGTISVKANNSCDTSAAQTLNVTVNTVVLTTTTTNAGCGSSNGTATVTATGGTSPYTYLWSNGASTSSASNLSSGNYSVTITDKNGCTTTASVTINNVSGPSATASGTDATCGNSNGTATVTATAGTSPYTYLWSNGASTSSATNIAAGSYTVTVTDKNGCTASATVTINNVSGPTATSNETDASCGNSNGTATVTATGGTSPYTYLWSNGASTSSATVLAAGNYSVTVTDKNGCTASATVTINNVSGPSATASATDASCGNSNGSATVTATGGTSPYTYLWSNGASTSSATALAAGNYTVTVTDKNGCTASATVTINNVSGPSATASGTDATCGNSNGTATVTATGGTSPYTYLWSNGASTSSATNMAAGNYSVTLTDANGCTASASVNINDIG